MNAQDFRDRVKQVRDEVIESLAFEAMDEGHRTGGSPIDLSAAGSIRKTYPGDDETDPLDAWYVLQVRLDGLVISGPLYPKDGGGLIPFEDLTTEQLIDTLEAVEKVRGSHG